MRLLPLLCLALVACDAGPAAPARSAAPLRTPGSSQRIVAIGDLHGDLGATRRALRLAGAIDERDRWVGGELIVVQTGDQLDRGDDEPAILALFDRLAEEARAAGGAVHSLLGNHEVMNIAGDLRYVTEGGFAAYPLPESAELPEPMRALPAFAQGRAFAFRPGGPLAKELSRRPVALVVGGNLFVHAGLLPAQARGSLEALNRSVAAWLRGEAPMPRAELGGEESPVWLRAFSLEPDAADCALARETLAAVGAERMVVGHTVQPSITAYCDGAVQAIDVGMSAHYGGEVSVLELTGGRARPLRER